MKREIAALAATVLVGASGVWAATADGTPGRDRTGGDAHHGHHEDGHDPGRHSWHDDEHWVTLRDASGHRVGSVVLRQRDETVEISARVSSLAPGFHGFHVHQVGLCEPGAAAGPFTTAGGHFPGGDPGGVTVHGEHAGDMPSLLAGEDGRAKLRLRTDRFTLEDLRDPDGSAVMVHSGPDNFANIPERYTTGGTAGPDATTLGTGDSGSRVACGVID